MDPIEENQVSDNDLMLQRVSKPWVWAKPQPQRHRVRTLSEPSWLASWFRRSTIGIVRSPNILSPNHSIIVIHQ